MDQSLKSLKWRCGGFGHFVPSVTSQCSADDRRWFSTGTRHLLLLSIFLLRSRNGFRLLRLFSIPRRPFGKFSLPFNCGHSVCYLLLRMVNAGRAPAVRSEAEFIFCWFTCTDGRTDGDVFRVTLTHFNPLVRAVSLWWRAGRHWSHDMQMSRFFLF